MITRPNEYKHQNDNYAFVDNDNVRGGIFTVPSLITTNLLLIPIDKRSISTTIVSKSDNQLYNYFGADKEDINWGNITNWKNPNTLPTGFTNQPITPLSGNTVISQIVVNTTGAITGIVPKDLTLGDIGAADIYHIHDSATQLIDGFMSSTDKTKLSGIESGAEVNQNAFSSISVENETLIVANEKESVLKLLPGDYIGIELSGDALRISSLYQHPNGFIDQPEIPLSGDKVITQVNVDNEGHLISVSDRSLTPANIGAATSGHTHNDATTVLSGFMSALDKTKLNGVFSKVSVNSTQLIPLSTDATVNFVAGTNITLGTANNDIIINASSSAHPTGFTDKPSVALTGASVISQIDVNDNGHVIGTINRDLTPADIGAATGTHGHADATTSVDGFMSSTDKTKLDGVFSKIAVNGVNVNATGTNATINFVEGANTTLTIDQNKVTIGGIAHPTGFTSKPDTALEADKVISQIIVNGNGHVTSVTSRSLTPASIGAATTSHTHSGFIPSGGTTGQLLVKNSATNYDVGFISPTYYNIDTGFSIFHNMSSTSSPWTEIITFLPGDGNLQGKNYTFSFDASKSYIFSSALDFRNYINGTISLIGNGGTVFIMGDSGYSANIGPIVPSSKITVQIKNLTFNLSATASYNSFITPVPSFRGGLFSAINCTFNFSGSGTTVFSLVAFNNFCNIVLTNCVISTNMCSASYLLGEGAINDTYNIPPLITMYFINISSASNLTGLATPGLSNTGDSFIHMYYKNLSTLVADPSVLNLGTYTTWVALP